MCDSKNFYVWLLQVFALLGLLAFLLWLTLRPKNPTYTIVDFSAPTSNQSNNTSSENGAISYVLEIQNPNKDSGIYYNDILLTFYYGQDSVGEKTIPSFYQGKHKTRQLSDHFDANARVWKALRSTILNATAELKVGLVTKIRYKMWGRKSKRHGMNLQGQIRIGSDGKISGKNKKIKLKHTSKRWRSRYA
ncbi:hypothetical protein L1049_010328 [Liquidambar formosana]|uniref:Late embryogenesis abundant protein LEA-2 subgroup domain-containing protein n=1 Tax=Liquidambar formosana TaxID=63359 RepID=A0AAP0N9N3_LIQFO